MGYVASDLIFNERQWTERRPNVVDIDFKKSNSKKRFHFREDVKIFNKNDISKGIRCACLLPAACQDNKSTKSYDPNSINGFTIDDYNLHPLCSCKNGYTKDDRRVPMTF